MDASRSAVEMLAMLFASGVESVVRRGLLRDYQSRITETTRLQGRIDFAQSLRRLSHLQARMVCHHDELDVDSLVNGIVRSTLDRLLASRALSPPVRQRLWQVAPALAQVPPVALQPGLFLRLQLPRHRMDYRPLLRICELLCHLAQPEEAGARFRFIDPWEGQRMPELFEEFVRNFLQAHLKGAFVGRRHFGWEAVGHCEADHALLPTMKTDVCIEWPEGRCLVLDCKYYEHALTTGQYGEARLRSSALYQMAAYLQHHPRARAGGGAEVHGLLLYPQVQADFLHRYDFMGRQLTVASLDLARPWQEIHERLLHVVAVASLGERC